VDQVIFVQQAGPNKHEHVCESLELFGDKVLPRFVDGREEREAAKRERLAEACERALSRRAPARHHERDYVITPRGEPTSAQVITAAKRAESNGAVNGRPRGVRGALASRLQSAGESAFASFVGRRTDAQLERIFGSGPGMKLIFRGMERAFVPERAQGFSGEVQYELTGSNGGRKWALSIADGHAVAEPREAKDPVVTFRTTVPVFVRMASQEIHPAKAMLEGQLEVEGDFEAAAKLGEMFGQDSLV
jgi:hypothetical protein